MAWFSIFAGALGGLLLAVLAYAAGWPWWLALLLYPVAGATLSGVVLLVLWTWRAMRRYLKPSTKTDENGPSDSNLASSRMR